MSKGLDEKKAVEALYDVDDTLRKNKIIYWLDGGALLGSVRDKRLIPWDNDIDLVMWESELPKIMDEKQVLKELSEKNFQMYLLDDKMVIERGNIPINLSLFRVKNNTAMRELLSYRTITGKFFKAVWWVLSVKYYNRIKFRNFLNPTTMIKHMMLLPASILPVKTRKSLADKVARISKKFGGHETKWHVPLQFFRQLSSIKIYGRNFKIPKKTSEYLTFRYGKSWNIPDKGFETLKFDGAVSNKD